MFLKDLQSDTTETKLLSASNAEMAAQILGSKHDEHCSQKPFHLAKLCMQRHHWNEYK